MVLDVVSSDSFQIMKKITEQTDNARSEMKSELAGLRYSGTLLFCHDLPNVEGKRVSRVFDIFSQWKPKLRKEP